jgi:hypothetical protein
LNKNIGNNTNRKKFESILLESIDEAFSTLGENVKKVIYFHLTEKFMITKQEIPSKIDDFSDALEKIFGLGARKLEILIITKLHNKISCDYEWTGPNWLVPDLTFSQYVELSRSYYEDRENIGQLEVIVDAEEQQQEQRA